MIKPYHTPTETAMYRYFAFKGAPTGTAYRRSFAFKGASNSH